MDADKQTQREVIDCYMEKGFGWLFDSQASFFMSLVVLYIYMYAFDDTNR